MKEAKSAVLLNECREFMTFRMRTSMSRMMGNVEDALFEMATGDCGTVQASHYIDAVREIRMKKREIQVRFENRFMTMFDEGVRQIRKGKRITSFSSAAGTDYPNVVSLDQTGTHAIASTVEKVRVDCRSALSALDKHIGLLLDNSNSTHFDNPLEPGMVFDAFWESCRDIQAGTDIRRVLVQMFEKHVAMDLQELYDDLNNLFASYEAADRLKPESSDDLEHDMARQFEQGEEAGVGKQSLLVKNWVLNRIIQRINENNVEFPEFVRRFLLQQWCLVMGKIYEKYGDNSREWMRTMQVMDDLITSVQPEVDRDRRQQQLWKLPGLIYRLKNAMKSASVPLKQQADFLSQLKAYHTSLSEFSAITGNYQ